MDMLLQLPDDDLYEDEFAMDPVAQRENAKRPMTAASICKYKFIRRLGGTAYLAKETNIRQDWRVIRKLKMGSLPLTSVEGVMQQLRSRQEAWAHPGLIQMQDLFDVDKDVYVVTEYCEGGTLGALVSRAKRYDEQLNEIEILDWLVQMLRTAEHLQNNNMVHGLISTGNILLKNNRIKLGETKQGREFHKIPDVFRLVHDEADPTSLCAHAPSQGRVTSQEMTYYSPEVIQDGPFTHKADVWAIGCVLWELCSQKRIFKADSLQNIVENITEKPIPDFPTYFSLELASMWRSIMIKDPDERPTVQEILQMPFMKEHIQDMDASEQQWQEQQAKLEAIDEET